MRKYIALSFLALATFPIAQGAPISTNQAREKALAFFQARANGKAKDVSLGKTFKGTPTAGAIPYYIFNRTDERGFVIVAGDNNAPSILAYSDTDVLNADNMPPALQMLLDGYAAEIKVAELSATSHSQAAPTSTTEARQVIAPLLTTHWGQTGIFAKQCFTADGKQAVAGDAATALAQVMNYHQYPKELSDGVSAYTTSKGIGYDALPPTVFEWDRMLDSYQGWATENQLAAVAHLVAYAAHASKTDFGSSYSSAAIDDCAAALSGCFEYANMPKVVARNECGIEEWDRLIYHELSHGRPVVYFAANGLNNTHAFVCDGYDGEGLYHINWGQEGDYDGYYRLHAVHPAALVSANSTTAFGYSMNHHAIVGIAPQAVDDNYEPLTDDAPTATWENLEVTEVQQRLGNNVKKVLRVTVENHGASDFAGPLRLYVNGSYSSVENLYVAAGATGYVDFYFVRQGNTYAIKVVDDASLQVLFEDDSFELVDVNVPQPIIKGYEVLTTNVATMTQHGTCFEIGLNLLNKSETDYFGKVEVKLFIIDEDSGAFVFTTTSTKTSDVAVASGATTHVQLKLDDLSVGDHFYYTINAAGYTIKGGSANRPYTVVEGYACWDSNGTRRMVALTETTQVPAWAAAVDFSGCDLTAVEIVPNGNPNTLYYIDTDTNVPTSLHDSHVVKGGTAVGDIVFYDGYGTFVPRSFDVEGEVAYERTFEKGGFGEDGWQTVILPFAVTQVTADEKVLQWQHGRDGNVYDFYLQRLNKVSADTAYFVPVDQWMPNTPYLVAVPNGRWGGVLDLTNTPLRFSATNTRVERTAGEATITATAMLSGTSGQLSEEEDIFVLNEAGDAFVKEEEATVAPFRCWFTERTIASLPYETIHIASQTPFSGDVNNDGRVSVIDVTLLVDFILGNVQVSLPLVAGDMNNDKLVSVIDVTLLVDFILGNVH